MTPREIAPGEPMPPVLDTPHGRLYRPLPQLWQIAVLVAAFAGNAGLAWLLGAMPGDLSDNAKVFLHLPPFAVFFAGYALWVARMNAIAFDGIGRSLYRTLFLLIVRRRKPASLADVMPSRDKLLEMLVRAQKAGASFRLVAVPIGLLCGVLAGLMDTAWTAGAIFLLVCLGCVGWGYALAWLGRHGWLPMVEES